MLIRHALAQGRHAVGCMLAPVWSLVFCIDIVMLEVPYLQPCMWQRERWGLRTLPRYLSDVPRALLMMIPSHGPLAAGATMATRLTVPCTHPPLQNAPSTLPNAWAPIDLRCHFCIPMHAPGPGPRARCGSAASESTLEAPHHHCTAQAYQFLHSIINRYQEQHKLIK